MHGGTGTRGAADRYLRRGAGPPPAHEEAR